MSITFGLFFVCCNGRCKKSWHPDFFVNFINTKTINLTKLYCDLANQKLTNRFLGTNEIFSEYPSAFANLDNLTTEVLEYPPFSNRAMAGC